MDHSRCNGLAFTEEVLLIPLKELYPSMSGEGLWKPYSEQQLISSAPVLSVKLS